MSKKLDSKKILGPLSIITMLVLIASGIMESFTNSNSCDLPGGICD